MEAPLKLAEEEADGIGSKPVDERTSKSERVTSLPNLHRWKYTSSILSLTVSRRFIFAGSQDCKILVFDLRTYQKVAALSGHGGSVLCLTVDPTHLLLISGASDGIIKVWDIETLKEISTIYSTLDIGDIFSVAYVGSIRTILFGTQNASISWCNLGDLSRYRVNNVAGLPGYRWSKFFDSEPDMSPRIPPAGTFNSAGSDILLAELPPENTFLYAHNAFVYALVVAKLSSGEELVLSGGGDGDVKVWNIVNSGKSPITLKHVLHNDLAVLSMTADSQFVYCGLTNGFIAIWDLDTCQMIHCSKAHVQDILTLSVFKDNIFSGSAAGRSKGWDAQFVCRHEWFSHGGMILASTIIYDPQENKAILVTGGNDDSLAIWDITDYSSARKGPLEYPGDALINALSKFVSYRTLSGDPQYASHCRRGASFLKSLFKSFGGESHLIPTTDGHNPIVFAKFKANCHSRRDSLGDPAPCKDTLRVLYYGHYDVITPGDQSAWATPPYVLTGLNGYLYGRGVSDNKGPLLAALFAVGELVREQSLSSDVVFLIEGEEENEGTGFIETVRKHKEVIGEIDWVLFSNSYWLDDSIPCLNYGLRGVIHATIKVFNTRPDLHSGVDGGVNSEPTTDIIRILACLKDPDGHVNVPDFYNDVRPISESERSFYDAIVRRVEHLGKSLSTESLMKRWRFPSLTIHNMRVSGPRNRTVIPHLVTADISIRIVPDQDTETIKKKLIKFIQDNFERLDTDNSIEVLLSHQAEPWVGDPENKAFVTLASAVKQVWGVEPIFIREGGSIPAARFLEKEFGAPASHLPCGQASDHAHLTNERLRVTNLLNAMKIFKDFFRNLSR